jgi:RNA polymerase sigma-70 factor (ECF subfamily)
VSDTRSEFVKILLQHQHIVHKICRAYCPLADDRQDMFQEIALQLWRSYPTFRGEALESTWIYRVALNVAISSLRRAKTSAKPLTDFHGQLPDLQDTTDSDEQMNMLYEAIYTLTDLEKALVLLYFEDKSMEEIAELTGTNAGNVRVKMHRIREKLRAHIQRIPSP